MPTEPSRLQLTPNTTEIPNDRTGGLVAARPGPRRGDTGGSQLDVSGDHRGVVRRGLHQEHDLPGVWADPPDRSDEVRWPGTAHGESRSLAQTPRLRTGVSRQAGAPYAGVSFVGEERMDSLDRNTVFEVIDREHDRHGAYLHDLRCCYTRIEFIPGQTLQGPREGARPRYPRR